MSSNQACYPTKLILKGTPEELGSLTAKKLLLVAEHCIDIPIVCETATPNECKELSNLAQSLVLLLVTQNPETGDEESIAVGNSIAMMKTIASLQTTDLSGVNQAMVDGFLSFIWKSMDLPIQAASMLLEDETTWETEKEDIEEDLQKALQKIETHLRKQQESLSQNNIPLSIIPGKHSDSLETNASLADLSLAATVHFMLEKNISVSVVEENPYLCRWKETIFERLGLSAKLV